jgi:hypothetical protein
MPSEEQIATLIREVSDLKMRVQQLERGGFQRARVDETPHEGVVAVGEHIAANPEHGHTIQQSEDLVRKGKEEQRAEDQVRREEQTQPANNA